MLPNADYPAPNGGGGGKLPLGNDTARFASARFYSEVVKTRGAVLA